MAKENQENNSPYKVKRAFKRFNQDFDKDKIFLTKAGKKFNVYDFIQEGRVDTEIEPTLKKYGCVPVYTQDTESMYQDFTAAQDLRGVLDRKIAAENAFYNLPIEVRREFDHNIDNFMKNGEKYIKDRIEKEKPKEQPQPEMPVTDNSTQEK